MVCTIALVCFGLGVFATSQMPVNLLPDIAMPVLGVTVAYPGASAETCDEDVRPLMENTLKTLSNVNSVTTQCIEHAAIALIQFDYGTDVDEKITELKDKFDLVIFPSACYDPIYIKMDFNGMAVATVSVCNKENPEQSYADAEVLAERFLSLENVASVSVTGAPETTIEITPLNGLEITTALILQTLMTNDQLDIPLGDIVQDGNRVSFRNESSVETIAEIMATPIQMPLTKDLASALSLAKVVVDYVQDTPSSEMLETKQNLKGAIDAILAAESVSGQQLLDQIEANVPVSDIILMLEAAGYFDAADSISSLYTYITENPAVLNIPGELLLGVQTVLNSTFTDEVWTTLDTVIEFKQEHEEASKNPITGETEDVPVSAEQLSELLTKLNLDLPLSITPAFIDFIIKNDFSSLDYDADGNANLNLRISDVATVEEVTDFPSKSYLNGYPAVTVQVYGISGANTTAISQAVKDEIGEIDGLLVSDIVLIDDQAQFINDSISNVLSSVVIGGVLAIIVIFLFLKRIRTSLIIGVTMPLSVFCSLICMYFMDITLNMVSLGGLAVGIGMLVDNSIVVIESITFEREKGKSAYDAAVDGTKLVAGSILASTLTSICVFFPILFTEGLTKMIFTDMSWSVIFSLSFSFIVAVTVIPTLYCMLYKEQGMLKGKLFEKWDAIRTNGFTKKAPASVENSTEAPENAQKRVKLTQRLNVWYDRFLRKSLKKRWLVLLLAFVVFAGSIGLIFTTGTEFLPSVDQRTIEITLNFDASDQLDYCEEQTMQVYNDLLTQIPDIQNLTVNVGKNTIASTSIAGTIRMIMTEDAKDTKKVLSDVRAITDNRGLDVSVNEVDGVLAALVSSVGGISNISVSVTGDDVEVLKEISEKVKAKTLADEDYFKSVTDNLTGETLEYKIRIDKMKCLELGVDYMVAVATLRAGIAGHTACTAEIDGEVINVNVRFKDGTIEDYYKGIENFMIGFGGDGVVTLGQIAEITPEYTYTVIKKENGKNTMSLSVETSGIDNGTASDRFVEIVNEVLADYEGYTAATSGVNHYIGEVFDGLIVALIVSFVLLFAVMACQFESLKKPFIVIFAIPFSFTGGLLAMVISGMTLNVVSFVGFIMLMGVAVNDAIVMVDRITQLEAEGYTRFEALVEGSKSRMRAIWMTTLTTVLALVPLALGIGKGAELMQPLSIVVIGGLTLCTFVTLVLIPLMYSIINRVPVKDEPATPQATEPTVTEPTVTEVPDQE